MTQEAVVRKARRDAWCKALGGFAVVRLSDGTLDYFPVGQVPTLNGKVDRKAIIIAKYHWTFTRWKRVA